MSGLEKDDLIEVIRKAKSSHIRWRSYAQALVDGVPLGEDRAPVSHTDCRFGLWYYGEGKEQLGTVQAFRDIEQPHAELHSIYAQIDALVAEGKLAEAREKLGELVEVSRSLLEKIERLEGEVI
jgi:hypothetical protein